MATTTENISMTTMVDEVPTPYYEKIVDENFMREKGELMLLSKDQLRALAKSRGIKMYHHIAEKKQLVNFIICGNIWGVKFELSNKRGIKVQVIKFVSWMFQEEMGCDFNKAMLEVFLIENEEYIDNIVDDLKKLIEEEMEEDPEADEDKLLKENILEVFEDHIRISRSWWLSNHQ